MSCYIVVGPKAADSPHQHDTKADAQREAERLARLHRGQVFQVWRCKPVLQVKFSDVQVSRLDALPEDDDDDIPF